MTNHSPWRIVLGIEMDRSPKEVQRRVDAMIERCGEAGLKVTPQRIIIYKALVSSEEHPTPEMLYRMVSRQLPSMSLATIYKTLDALASVGLVHPVAVDSDKRRYDANDAPHHHLVCSACGAVRDYYSHAFDALMPPAVKGFRPHAISVSITGVCNRCRTKRKEA